MFFKKFKRTLIAILLALYIMPSYAFAYSDYIVAGGKNIGMELNAKGVIVVGLYKVDNSYPAGDAGLKVGDMITSINDTPVSSITDMVDEIDKSSDKNDIKIEYLRNNVKNVTSLKLSMDNNGVFKTGLYVKDSVSGVGTLSFIDPETKLFGALGHEILEKTTGKILEIKDGKIFDSTVTGIIKSENGNPGEKNAKLEQNNTLGSIDENTNKGVFGIYSGDISTEKLYKVAKPSEVKVGSAEILTVLDDKTIEAYDINIIKLNKNQDTKGILFEVTDEELLNKTGGIIQGMSGSPIIQDDLIIGAVTHVVVDNPTKGYGIFITNMLEEAEN